jgi:methionine-rich copper-binding protein CopC
VKVMNQKFCTFLLILSASTLSPVLASAHAHLKKSSPAKDAVLSELPVEVVLHFSEALEPSMCKLTVKDVETGELLSTGSITQESGDANSLKMALNTALARAKKTPAQYEVAWKAVSKDAHSMPGSYKFRLQPVSSPASKASPAR